MKKYFAVVALAVVLTSCATVYKPVPDGYTGPTARVIDTTIRESSGKGQVFFVASVNGMAIKNARSETARLSYGRGFSLYLVGESRHVKIEPMKLKLVGAHVTAAPIHEISSRAIGEFFSVDGDVDFEPVAGREYSVVGELTKAQASVWIQDQETKQPVTTKVVAK
jgi:hypothetical protein